MDSLPEDTIVWTFKSVVDAAENLMRDVKSHEEMDRKEFGSIHPGLQDM